MTLSCSTFRCTPKSSSCPSNSRLKPLSNQCIEASVQKPLEKSLQQNLTFDFKTSPYNFNLPDFKAHSCAFEPKPSWHWHAITIFHPLIFRTQLGAVIKNSLCFTALHGFHLFTYTVHAIKSKTFRLLPRN